MHTVAVLALLNLVTPPAIAVSLLKVPFTSTLIANSSAVSDPTTSTTNAVLKVVTAVQAGNNQTWQNVLVDTGSALLWVGAGTEQYAPGPYTDLIDQTFSVGYGGSDVNGTAYVDRVTIGAATVNSQIIGSAGFVNDFTLVKPFDGILGLGPSGSNTGEVSGYNSTATFVENLVSQGTIQHPVFGMYVSPLAESGVLVSSGEISFGGIDETRISGDVAWLPQNQPSNFHWEFNSSSLTWGDELLTSGQIYSRTDSGELGIGIPFDTFFSVLQSVPGAVIDLSSNLDGFLVFPGNMTVESLPDMTIGIANLNFTIPASKYVVPSSLYSALNISDSDLHTWITSGGPDFFLLGQKFLENAYSAYDMENHLVGFAYLAA
ncbi:Polyporopepsin [Sparassis crispa]|uniref:Polyporopepsin n=1 Tax=Sparassis crispa TaxID=139825 RepID=A0A401GYH7_9APHY|nr:Polyporopepsin [Sparassis crispa]GBE87004.1 Polyporopepsin [Sparassis crispa]